jgi:hypothetical protein
MDESETNQLSQLRTNARRQVRRGKRSSTDDVNIELWYKKKKKDMKKDNLPGGSQRSRTSSI